MLEKITNTFSNIVRTVSGKSTITEKNIEDTVEQIKMALLEADVNLRVVRRFVNATIEEAKGEKVLRAVDPGQQFVKIIYDRIVKMLGDQKVDLQLKGPDTQSVILLLGLQGAGKTTAAHKLAARLLKEGRKPVLVACDLVRPAAVEQLKTLGEKIGVSVYFEDGEKNAVKVAKNGLSFAKKNGFDTVIVDTAGRLAVDEELMQELKNIKAEVNVHQTILTVDSMTGQDAVNVASTFDEALNIDGVILTKLDSDTRGGAALSIRAITGKPIYYVGMGEKLSDLEQFYPDRMASRILGMGDVMTLIEKAEAQIDQDKAAELTKKFKNNEFDFNDFLEQMQQMKKMGGLSSILSMMPGMGLPSDLEIDDDALKGTEAIIYSMTLEERTKPSIINPSRKRRIAAGAGVDISEVNRLVKQFEQSKKMMKHMSGMMSGKKMKRGGRFKFPFGGF